MMVLGFEITEDVEDSDSEIINEESGAQNVRLAETKDRDLESGKHSCSSVLMTGKAVSTDAVNETARTANTTGSGCTEVPTIAGDSDTNG